MANVWEVSAAANRYLCVQQLDLRFFNERFIGVPMADGWEAPAFDVLNKSKKVADFTSWQIASRALLVSRRAKDVISSVCGDEVEFLPFATIKRTELFAMNVLRLVDVIDWSNSTQGAAPITLKSGLSDLPVMFKDLQHPDITFASDALGAITVEQGLTGLQLADPCKNLGAMIVRGQSINEYPGL